MAMKFLEGETPQIQTYGCLMDTDSCSAYMHGDILARSQFGIGGNRHCLPQLCYSRCCRLVSGQSR